MSSLQARFKWPTFHETRLYITIITANPNIVNGRIEKMGRSGVGKWYRILPMVQISLPNQKAVHPWTARTQPV